MYEGNQTFNLVVALAPGETDASIFDGTGVGTIVDDDPIPTLTINDPAALLEPNVAVNSATTAPMTFTITLTGAHEQASSVVWSTAERHRSGCGQLAVGVTNSTDYLPVPDRSLPDWLLDGELRRDHLRRARRSTRLCRYGATVPDDGRQRRRSS